MKKLIVYLLVLSSLLAGCLAAEGGGDAPPDVPFDLNAIFVGVDSISVISPLNGDTLSDIRPRFTWVDTGSSMVFVGIFVENINVSAGNITNINDNIWAWHSGLGKGRVGSVAFEDGFDAINGILQTDQPPTPLAESTPYIWAIWAWSEDGRYVTHASQELLFVTGTDN